MRETPKFTFATAAPMAARKLAPMAVGVRPKREIIREPGEQRIPPDSNVRVWVAFVPFKQRSPKIFHNSSS